MSNYKTIISLMSGTSIDSVDALMVKIFDDLSFEIVDNYSLSYPSEVRNMIFKTVDNKSDVSEVCSLNFLLGQLFAQAVNELLQKTDMKKEEIDFISSHGQTVFHIPEKKNFCGFNISSTLQLGDISVISHLTGIKTVGDFRTKDMAAGGQGAPLVPFADEILFKKDKNRLIQNIGGISNVTVLTKDKPTFAFDNGVGNILSDYFSLKLFGEPFDKGGEFALKGKVDTKWLELLLSEPYYKKLPPKTTGRELFSSEYAEKLFLSAPKDKYDVMATIAELTASVIYNSYCDFIFNDNKIDEVVLGGGGAFNKAIVGSLRQKLSDIPLKTHADFNIPDKFKECLAFAYLGYFTLLNKPNNLPSCTGANKPVVMGKIAY
ncbi:anhydro-N-acetylmuramic acid kinase [bacterium]|nr:anhydro-N-acetylmuramic acid kinase [bacterium]